MGNPAGFGRGDVGAAPSTGGRQGLAAGRQLVRVPGAGGAPLPAGGWLGPAPGSAGHRWFSQPCWDRGGWEMGCARRDREGDLQARAGGVLLHAGTGLRWGTGAKRCCPVKISAQFGLKRITAWRIPAKPCPWLDSDNPADVMGGNVASTGHF